MGLETNRNNYFQSVADSIKRKFFEECPAIETVAKELLDLAIEGDMELLYYVKKDILNLRDDRPKLPPNKDEYSCWCPKCGFRGGSHLLGGGNPIADTGDFDDPYCPICFSKDIEDFD